MMVCFPFFEQENPLSARKNVSLQHETKLDNPAYASVGLQFLRSGNAHIH
jgi:hypothetical protein